MCVYELYLCRENEYEIGREIDRGRERGIGRERDR